MKRILHNKDGFSLSELLMVVAILSLIIVILGSGVMVVKNAYENITVEAHAQVVMSTAISQVTDEFRNARYVDAGVDETDSQVSFVSGRQGYRIFFTNDSTGGIIVSNGVEDGYQLLTDKAMTDGLIPAIEYRYDEENGLFTAVITVTKDDKEFCSQEIKVRPIV